MPRPYQKKGKGSQPSQQQPPLPAGAVFVDPAVASMQAAVPPQYQQPMPAPQYQMPHAHHHGAPQPRSAHAYPVHQAPAGVPAPRGVHPIAAPKGYKCTGCGKSYQTVDALASHMETANHGTWFDCKVASCGWSFVTQQCLMEHNAKFHPQQQRPVPQQQPQYQQQQQQQQGQPSQRPQPSQQPVYNVAHLQAQLQGNQQQQQPRHGNPPQQQRQGQHPVPPPRGAAHGNNTFANMAANAARNPQPMTKPMGGPPPPKANLQEGGMLTNDSKKTYDAIVKVFIDDPTRGDLQFPPTLTAQERHHVHKLCMHYSLDHQSTGAGATRQLRIWKPNFVNAAAADSDDEAGLAGSSFDGFTGCQPLNDEYLADHVDDLEAIVRHPNMEMQEKLVSTLAHAAVADERRKRKEMHNLPGTDGGSCAWYKGRAQPADKALRDKGASIQDFRRKLPAYKMKEDIIRAVRGNQVTVLSGDTGCGKTTQLPQLLFDAGIGQEMPGRGMILCTQPRRVSAISVAQRVAQERGERCGDSVGYSIRFENVVSENTRMLFLTTGILLRRLHTDPELHGVSTVIVDEVHERDVDTDFALLLLRDLVWSGKTKLRLVVMSATIQVEKLVDYFKQPKRPLPPLISIPGALFDVKEYFLDDALQWLGVDPKTVPAMATAIEAAKAGSAAAAAACAASNQQSSYADMKEAALANLDKKATETTVPVEVICGIIDQYHKQAPRSNAVLVFLPGWAAIDKTMNMLRQKYPQAARELSILPLHSSLTTSEQQRVFVPAPKNFRKVVLATNIAETSITIDDIVLVIDSCLHKGTSYDSAGNTSSLTSQLIAKANGRQRRGRAGRVAAGVCVHLLPKASYEKLPDFLLPEMQRTALEEICLQVKAIVSDRTCLDVLSRALDAPPAISIAHAVDQLYAVGALDSKERLTALGRVLASMPLHPALGKMLLLGAAMGVFDPLCTLAAALSGKSPFVKPMPHQMIEARRAQGQFDLGKNSDHFAVLELYGQWSRAPRRSDFAFQNWADHMVLNHIERMRSQLRNLLNHSGFLKKAPAGWESRYATNDSLVRFALAHSLTPRLAVMERDHRNRHNNVFCWDNKPCGIHPSSGLSRMKLKDVSGCEFFVYFDRMRVESQLSIFDATSLSRTTAVLAAKTLDLHDTASIDEATRVDDRKFRAWDSPCRDPKDEEATLVVDGGKKRFTVSRKLAEAMLAVHDVVNFNFAVSLQRMDITAVPDDVVCALAIALGEPAKPIDPKRLEDAKAEAAGGANVRLGPTASAMAPNVMDSSDDEFDDYAPEVDNGTDDDLDDAADDGAAVGGDAKADKLSAAEADILVRAFGDLSWITRRATDAEDSEATESKAASPAVTTPVVAAPVAQPKAKPAASAPAPVAPLAAAAAAAADDDDDSDSDDEGDEIVAAPADFF